MPKFDEQFVLDSTVFHMREAIKRSQMKTIARIEEFAHDREKSEEIFRTLGTLAAYDKHITHLVKQ